ncbi:MAG TPA: glycoside hydrolase family 25 protein [Thermoanaerobaculia bacterium]|nr:glycoside hydrolase family 25 protein [Thermoanaerobaculia bacterium]
MSSEPSSIRGIDVSKYQGTIDWSQVATAGLSFVFMKASEGITSVDPELSANWSGARTAGLLRGAYHFYRPGDDPTQQAEHFLATVQLGPGDLPPVLDVETADGVSADDIVQGVATWLDVVQKATGRTPIIYTSHGFWDSLGSTHLGGYPLWIAEYGVSSPVVPAGWTRWTFWQYSDSGTVAGIQGAVDLDVFQGSLEELRALAEPLPH